MTAGESMGRNVDGDKDWRRTLLAMRGAPPAKPSAALALVVVWAGLCAAGKCGDLQDDTKTCRTPSFVVLCTHVTQGAALCASRRVPRAAAMPPCTHAPALAPTPTPHARAHVYACARA